MLKFIFYVILTLQFCIVRAEQAEQNALKASIKNPKTIKDYNTSDVTYLEEEGMLYWEFTRDNCNISIKTETENGIYKRYINITSPSNLASKQCFDDLKQNVLDNAFEISTSDLIERQSKIISNDYIFSRFNNETTNGYLKANNGSIRFILYDCPLDANHCEAMPTELTNH